MTNYDKITSRFTLMPIEKAGRVWGESAWVMRGSSFGPSPIERAGMALRQAMPALGLTPAQEKPNLRVVKGGRA